MNKNIPSALVALGTFLGLTAPPLQAEAIELTINNTTDAKLTFAFSYLSNKTDTWVVDGWYNVDPKKQGIITLNTDNGIFYIYGEFSNGRKIEGGKGALKLGIKGETFFYEQSKGLKDKTSTVAFLRAKADSAKSKINIK